MGGLGSGRWRWPRKTTVEECLFIDVNQIRRRGFDGVKTTVVFAKSSNALRRKAVGEIGFRLIESEEKNPVMVFEYSIKSAEKEQKVAEPVPLQHTKLCSGGLRWWFTCPLAKDEKPCLRRVRMLYMPPEGVNFGCRYCYDLTYRSCQESHRKDWIYEAILKKNPHSHQLKAKRAAVLLREQFWLKRLPSISV